MPVARVRRVARVAVAPCTIEERCASEKPFSFGSRPRYDMSTAASYLRSRLSRDARGRATALARSWRGGAPRALAARARRAARVVVVPCVTEGHGTGKRPLSFGARLRCDVTAAASNAQPTFAWRARVRHCARCLLGGGAARALAARARRAALVVVELFTIKGHCTGRRALSFGARPCCDVPATASKAQSACASVLVWALGLALSWERRRSTRVSRARAPHRAGCPRSMFFRRTSQRREASIFLTKTVLRCASCGS